MITPTSIVQGTYSEGRCLIWKRRKEKKREEKRRGGERERMTADDKRAKALLRKLNNVPASNSLGLGRYSKSRIETPQPFDIDLIKAVAVAKAQYRQSRSKRKKRKSIKKPNIGARGLANHKNVTSTSVAVTSAGGFDLLRHGFAHFKSAGLTSRYRQKFLVLEKGVINIYNPKDVIGGEAVPTVLPPELSLSLLDLRAIGYQKRGDKIFGLVFGTNEAIAGRRARKRLNSKGSFETASVGSPSSGSSRTVYNEKTFYFKLKKGSDAELWLTALLAELRNQAQFLELSADRIMNIGGRDDTAEIVLRQCVDMYLLSCGKYHKNTVFAQERLGKFLKKKPSTKEEGKFWAHCAQHGGKILRKLEKLRVGEYIMQQAKLIKVDSPVSQLQFQTQAIYKMKTYKEKVVSLKGEAKKWKARAVLYGYGDRKSKEKPLRNLRYSKEAVMASQGELRNKNNLRQMRNKRVGRATKEEAGRLCGGSSKSDSDAAFSSPESQTRERKARSSLTSHLTLSTAPGKKETKKLYLQSLPSVLTDSESEMETEAESIAETEESHAEDSGSEVEEHKFIRRVEFSTGDPAYDSLPSDNEDIWGQEKKFAAQLDHDVYLSTSGSLEADNESTEEKPSKEVPLVQEESTAANVADKVEVETEKLKEENRVNSTTELMKEFLINEKVAASTAKPEATEQPESRQKHRVRKSRPGRMTSTKHQGSDSLLKFKLNHFDSQSQTDAISIDLNVLKTEFQELVTDEKTPSVQAKFKTGKKQSYFSRPVDRTAEVPPACYLLYSPAHKGSLFMRWSKRNLEQEALMKFSPPNPEKIPKYKYRIRSGLIPSKRDEIVRNIQGSYGKRKMFQGVNTFLKEAVKYDADLQIFGSNVNFTVYLYDEATAQIDTLSEDLPFRSIKDRYDAVVVANKNVDLFKGITTCARSYFLSIGRKKGAAIVL